MPEYLCVRCGRSMSSPGRCMSCGTDDMLQTLAHLKAMEHAEEVRNLQAQAAREQIEHLRRREREAQIQRRREERAERSREVDELCRFADAVAEEIRRIGNSSSAHSVLAARIAHRFRDYDLERWSVLFEAAPELAAVAYAQLRKQLVPYVRQLWLHRERMEPTPIRALRTIARALQYSDAAAFAAIGEEIASREQEVGAKLDDVRKTLRAKNAEATALQSKIVRVEQSPQWAVGLALAGILGFAMAMALRIVGMPWADLDDSPTIAAGLLIGSLLFAIPAVGAAVVWRTVDTARWKEALFETQKALEAALARHEKLEKKFAAIEREVHSKWADPALAAILATANGADESR